MQLKWVLRDRDAIINIPGAFKVFMLCLGWLQIGVMSKPVGHRPKCLVLLLMCGFQFLISMLLFKFPGAVVVLFKLLG